MLLDCFVLLSVAPGSAPGIKTAIDTTAATAASINPSSSPSLPSQQRHVIESNETYVPPPNPYLEEEQEMEEEPKISFPTEKWMDSDVVLVDCFEEVVDQEKLNKVDLIGVSRCGVVLMGVVILARLSW